MLPYLYQELATGKKHPLTHYLFPPPSLCPNWPPPPLLCASDFVKVNVRIASMVCYTHLLYASPEEKYIFAERTLKFLTGQSFLILLPRVLLPFVQHSLNKFRLNCDLQCNIITFSWIQFQITLIQSWAKLLKFSRSFLQDVEWFDALKILN